MKTLVLFVALLAVGCSDSPCQELETVCALCPTDGNSIGIAAGDSCNRTVKSNDEDACQDRLDQNTYSALGCTGE